ncbi:general transcriptional corepressor TUP1, partial [Phenoliferia sp. Uapishka_3]
MFNPNVKRVLDVGLVHTLVHDSVVCCVKFSPDGKILATGCNRNTTLYDTKTGAKISVLFDEGSGGKSDNYIRSASFSPDGKLLATGSEDRVVRIWNIAQKRISKVFTGHKSEIYSLAFSPDGRRLVSGSGDKTARIWDMETGACVYTLSIDDVTVSENGPVDAGVTSVVMSPDGKYLAAGSLDTVVRVWDAATGQLLDKLKGHKDSVYSVAFSPDGKFLVSGSLDKTLKMWDMGMVNRTMGPGEESKIMCMTTLQGHKDYVLSVAISPDGAWIVSGSKDRGVQFWDPHTARAQFMLQGHKNSVISVAVSEVGGLVATGSGDWSARIWSYERIAAN